MHKKFQVDWTNIDGVMAIIVISPLHYGRWGQRPPEWPKGPWGPKWPPSPPQELEGGLRCAPNLKFLNYVMEEGAEGL